MAQADRISTTRRSFLAVAAAAIPAITATAVAASPADPDAAILALELEIGVQFAAADAIHNNQILPLCAIRDERWGKDRSWFRSPEGIAFTENKIDPLIDVQSDHLDRADDLIKEMWAIPPRTEIGRAAKVRVLLTHVMPHQGHADNWQTPDPDADYHVFLCRSLLLQLAGMRGFA